MGHKVKWLGHSTTQVITEQGKVILIDPWITGNPNCPVKKEDLDRVDLILITHDHFDHIGQDVPELVQKTGATVVGQPEIGNMFKEQGVPEDKVINGLGMNIGGQVEVDGIKVLMTQATHSGTAGDPAGYIIFLEKGKAIYHAGDTGIFESMRLFGELYDIELALLPIGSVFVMDPVQAAHSLTLLKPNRVVPIHYGTFPILVQDTGEFKKLAGERAPGVKVEDIKPGEEVSI